MSIESIVAKLAASVIGGMIIEQLVEIRLFVILILLMVVADLITGISAARCRKEKISSWCLRRTINKFSLYTLAIVLSQGMEYVFQIPQIVYVVAFYICATEFISNLENIGEVTGTNIAAQIKDVIKARLK